MKIWRLIGDNLHTVLVNVLLLLGLLYAGVGAVFSNYVSY